MESNTNVATTATTSAPTTAPASTTTQAAATPSTTTAQNATTPTETNTVGSTEPVDTKNVIGTEVVEEWKPDFKLRVMDKDYEWNKYLKSITNKENYEELKKLQEKALGLDSVKERFNSTREELKKHKEAVESYQKQFQTVEYLTGLIEKGKQGDTASLQAFLQAVDLPEQVLLKWAVDRVNYRGLPPEQQKEYDLNMESRQRLMQLEQQNNMLQQQMQQQVVMQRTQQLESYISRPDIKGIAESFEARNGEGSFKNAIIEQGALAAQLYGQDLTVEQATERVIKLIGANLNGVEQAQIQQQAQVQMPVQQAPQVNQKPVIPTVKANSKSPAKKVYKSISELRELSQQI